MCYQDDANMAALKELYTRKESQKSPDNKAVNG